MADSGILGQFHPVVRNWFRATYGEPTLPQSLGWPAIAEGHNTLILAPTGSGKTLAAFLWAINHLIEQHINEVLPEGVRILYVSPLKALNNDIHRNLQTPLRGIHQQATAMGLSLPQLRTAVRTGDTPQAERRSMIGRPPDILITTPESLYLMLTAKRSREMFRTVQYVIVDEIHAISGNKRGVHLALTLERLQAMAEQEVVRIGLSATQRPLEDIAAFLGGNAWSVDPAGRRSLQPRPVAIIDAGEKKEMDLRVECPVPDFSIPSDEGAWPSLFERIAQLIRQHTTTLVFVNNRRLAERLATELSMLLEPAGGAVDETNLYGMPHRTSTPSKGEPVPGPSMAVQAYHGSMSRESRHAMEEALKSGQLRALVATSSLELGIDIGNIDLVVQVQSPHGVSRGLQRIGRSGHLVHAISKGKIFPTHREDLVEATVIAEAMLKHEVEETTIPSGCLDVLAQQVAAMTAAEDWKVDRLYEMVQQAQPYRALSRDQFTGVVAMLAGRTPDDRLRPPRAIISWDVVHGILRALPGTLRLAVMGGGTIADRGTYGVYLESGEAKMGEVDEEFVYESRVGDTFILGSSVWRITAIDANKVIVVPAPGEPARMPFWHGEGFGRPAALGRRIGAFRRAVEERLDDSDCAGWLLAHYPIDADSAANIVEYFRRQREATGCLPHDRLLVVESFADEIGDPRMIVHSPLGRRINGLLGMFLSHRMQESLGISAQMLYNDDGILFRAPDIDDLPVELFRPLHPDTIRRAIVEEIVASPLFAACFRQNASRALLMPPRLPGKRTPLWLQRLHAGDLLASARQQQDFPIVIETMREVLNDVLDYQQFIAFLRMIAEGEVQIRSVATGFPSPFARGLLFDFLALNMYAGDGESTRRSPPNQSISGDRLAEILPAAEYQGFLKADAIETVDRRLQHTAQGYQARTAEELMQIVSMIGDMSEEEILARCVGDGRGMMRELVEAQRIVPVPFAGEERWVAAEDVELYARLDSEQQIDVVVRKYLKSHGPLPRSYLVRRYGIAAGTMTSLEQAWSADRTLLRGRFRPPDGGRPNEDEWCYRPNIEQAHRQTVALLRKEVVPVPLQSFGLFMEHWTGLLRRNLEAEGGTLEEVLDQMQGLVLPAELWERDVLRRRIARSFGEELRQLTRSGQIVWRGAGAGKMFPFWRGNGGVGPLREQAASLSEHGNRILATLQSGGAMFFSDLRSSTGLSLKALNAGLAELFWRGDISNDAFDEILALRRAVRMGDDPIEPIQILTPYHNPHRSRLLGSARKALKQVPGWTGRWFALDTPAILGEPLFAEEQALAQVRQLLGRYGVLAREIAAREDVLPWSILLRILQQMELRGEVRRGFFVQGLSGMQFATHDAAEEIRGYHTANGASSGIAILSACDPASVYGPGIDLPSEPGKEPVHISRSSGTYLALLEGAPVVLFENGGSRIHTLGRAQPPTLDQAIALFVSEMRESDAGQTTAEMIVEFFDGSRPAGSAIEPVLRRLGFIRDRNQTMRADKYSL